ncbi:uncharacterized protein HD556DRAFT_1345730 [Suillus plorans]|uniref:Uncharacterized protein n=1 Tax=Suillus plorans TaxID=116603 RepID=A0A9P7J2R2_9AGAM|nr:uncharacterized protein HD556DRAFT_1345730 [Suillus plorans]KAG1799899.1 hypothetical protein HD556DRAFT_1345730 [Suillus plorans]
MSPRPFVKNLTFQSNDLGKEVTIMLAWSPNVEGLYEDVFPIVWKVSKFGKSGPYRATATYTAQLAFARAQVESGKVISAATSVNINNSEKTILTEANDVYHFSPPQAGTAGILQAQNHTGSIQEIAVGFVNKGDFMPTPVLFFSDVGDGSRVTAKFTPVLRAYITSDYEETSILRGQVDTPAIWSQDLTGLAQNTTWNLSRDANTGRYTITHA